MLGEAQILVGGKPSSVWKTNSSTEVNISGGGIISSFSGTEKSGDVLLLDANGNFRIDRGDKLTVRADGYEPNSTIEVWLFSNPTKLTSSVANDQGVIEVLAEIPASVDEGDHRLVVEGTNADGELVVIVLGVTYGELVEGSFSAGRLLGLPLVVAVFFGLFLPRTMRRLRSGSL
jgi:hypothetical protein